MGDQLVLSVRHPHVWDIINGGKDVENRRWRPPRLMRIWIHAGKEARPLRLAGTTHAARVRRHHRLRRDRRRRPRLDLTVAAPGVWHWVLANPRPLTEPIPLRGRQMLFKLPSGVVIVDE